MTQVESPLTLIREEMSKRFELELGWKENLESRAADLLGFVGVFLAILVGVATTRDNQGALPLSVLLVPTAHQVFASFLLLTVIRGHRIDAGPRPILTLQARAKPLPWLELAMAVSYGYAVMRNRVQYARFRFVFEMAVVSSAFGMLQLGFSVAGLSMDPGLATSFWGFQWGAWRFLFALMAIVVGFFWVRHYNLSKRLNAELAEWVGYQASGESAADEVLDPLAGKGGPSVEP